MKAMIIFAAIMSIVLFVAAIVLSGMIGNRDGDK